MYLCVSMSYYSMLDNIEMYFKITGFHYNFTLPFLFKVCVFIVLMYFYIIMCIFPKKILWKNMNVQIFLFFQF